MNPDNMGVEVIMFGGESYPKFQSEGFAAQFAIPFAKHVCKGFGLDIGAGRPEWIFPGAMAIDPRITPGTDAMKLPDYYVDYIFSSHCLEHLPNWVAALDHWCDHLKTDGVLFLYLPDYSQHYWRSWNNRKHIHNLTPQMISDYMKHKQFLRHWVSGVDLNNSFIAMGQK